jgi:two-component system sensor histidine kinase/response regulator
MTTPNPNPNPRRIMVVDDTPENLRLLEEVLRREGHLVFTLPTGAMALKAAEKNPPDLILLDVAMPRLGGIEVCRRLKAIPQLAEIPVIFLSALTDTEHRLKGFQVGGVDYIAKPVELEEVLARVRTHLRLRELQREVVDRNHDLELAVERLKSANKELEAFAYSVSHDLRAPLRNLESLGRILEEDSWRRLGPDGRDVVTLIRAKVRQMDVLIEDLLAFSTACQRPLEWELVDLQEIARGVYQELGPALQGRDVDFRLNRMPVVRGDPTLLRLVFMNLIANALKFSRQRPRTELEVGGRTDRGEHVIHVSDNGAGFDMKFAHKLFTVFQRLHNATEFEGTGIGLALVQRVIHRHGGRVWAEGKVNEGATFYFTVPCTRPA